MSRNRAERLEETLESVTDQVRDCIERGKFSFEELQDAVVQKTRGAAERTDEYVHENSWKLLGIVGLMGIVIGLLIPRR